MCTFCGTKYKRNEVSFCRGVRHLKVIHDCTWRGFIATPQMHRVTPAANPTRRQIAFLSTITLLQVKHQIFLLQLMRYFCMHHVPYHRSIATKRASFLKKNILGSRQHSPSVCIMIKKRILHRP